MDLIPKLEKSNYRIILVQIQEAHSKYWPLGMDNHPDIQHNLDERIVCANEFTSKFNISGNKGNSAIRVLIDPWGDIFENTYQAWPDQYYIIEELENKNKNNNGICIKILQKSEYSIDAKIIEDYTDYLYKILN